MIRVRFPPPQAFLGVPPPPMPKKPGIPEVRVRMHDLADRLDAQGDHEMADELRQMAEDTKRIYRKVPARAKARKMTTALAQAIRVYAMNHPEKLLREIGLRFRVDSGRVSEAISGKR